MKNGNDQGATVFAQKLTLTCTLIRTPRIALAFAKSRNSARVKNLPFSLYAGFLGKAMDSCGCSGLINCADEKKNYFLELEQNVC